jgi:DNA-directed RNA polymerase subunit RPC12/RpoP
MEEKKLSITCPLCGRKSEFPVESLVEGSVLTCPLCKVKLTLHGHMWEEIQADIRRLNEGK